MSTWDDLNVEYAAKGWPLIDPRSRDYCYQPCENGLHVCGFHPDGLNFLTIANFSTRTPEAARTLFEAARLECAAAHDEPCDLVIDLQQDGECAEDFPMTRQMLARLEAVARERSDTGRRDRSNGQVPGMQNPSPPGDPQ